MVKRYILKVESLPDRHGSVEWALCYKVKGRRLDCQSGHMPGLLARSLAGGQWEANDQCFSPSLSPFLRRTGPIRWHWSG